MKKLFKQVLLILLFLFVFINVIAVFQAYKLTHFYDRINNKNVPLQKPETMSGWQKTKAILFGVNSYKQAITTTPAHPYQTFHTTTNDGIILEGWYVQKDSAKGTVILFHGHANTRSAVVTEANNFYNFGYNVCMVDFRGHGNSQGNICTIGYNESADVKAAYDYVAAKGETNIVLWGISLGAATITKAMTDYTQIQPSKIILEMPFADLPDAVKGRLRLMHLPPQPLATLLTFWGGTEQGFWAFSLKPSDYVKNIHVPVLMQWGKKDIRVTSDETKEIFQNLSSAQKELVVYDNSGHESLVKNEPGKWNATVKAFLEK